MFVVDAEGGAGEGGSNRGSRTKVKTQEEAGRIGNCWLDGITQPVVHISVSYSLFRRQEPRGSQLPLMR